MKKDKLREDTFLAAGVGLLTGFISIVYCIYVEGVCIPRCNKEIEVMKKQLLSMITQ